METQSRLFEALLVDVFCHLKNGAAYVWNSRCYSAVVDGDSHYLISHALQRRTSDAWNKWIVAVPLGRQADNLGKMHRRKRHKNCLDGTCIAGSLTWIWISNNIRMCDSQLQWGIHWLSPEALLRPWEVRPAVKTLNLVTALHSAAALPQPLLTIQ